MKAWGLEVLCLNPAEYSSSLTAVLVPTGTNADELRRVILEQFNMSLGNGLGRLQGKVFRIGPREEQRGISSRREVHPVGQLAQCIGQPADVGAARENRWASGCFGV